MGLRLFDDKAKANKNIHPFVSKLNSELSKDPKKARNYNFDALCKEFSEYIKRPHPYAKSSMSDILDRNGYRWLFNEKRIIQKKDLYEIDDLFVDVDPLFPIEVTFDVPNKNRSIVRDYLEANFSDDISFMRNTKKGLILFTNDQTLTMKIKAAITKAINKSKKEKNSTRT